MPDFIKLGSDRPDYEQVLRDDEERLVDLTNASAVYMLMWDESGNLLINDQATVEEATLGEVSYDLQRGQVISAGINEIEFRVEWNNGDRQWFPTQEPGYELEVVRAAGDRDASLEDTDAQTDAEVNRILVHDAIDVQDDDGEMSIVNGSVAIPDGDLTVAGTVTIGDLVFGDDDPLTFGVDNDFQESYDSTSDVWKIRNAIAGLDVLTLTKGGDLTTPNGYVSGEALDVTSAGSEQNLRFGSKDSGVTTHAYVRALIESSSVTGDSVLVLDDSDSGTGVVRVNLATGEAEFDGSVLIGGDTAATQAWATGGNIAHADLGDAPAAAHHGELTVEDSGTEVSVGDYVLNFGSSLNVSHDSQAGIVTVDNPVQTQYTDEDAQDAVAAAMGDHFTYDDANDLLQLEPGNIAHDDHSGINETNHHAAFITQDGGTQVSENVYTVNFGSGLAATLNSGVVTVENTGGSGGYGDEDAQDAVGTILSSDFTYDDANDLINMDPHVGTAGAHHAKTTSAADLTDVSADSVSDAHHAKTATSDVTSSNWGDREIFVQSTEPSGWSDGDLWFEPNN